MADIKIVTGNHMAPKLNPYELQAVLWLVGQYRNYIAALLESLYRIHVLPCLQEMFSVVTCKDIL